MTDVNAENAYDEPDPWLKLRFRTIRIQNGMTLDDLATKLDVSKTHISRLERKDVYPSLPLFVRLCAALHTTPNDVLAWNE